MQLGFRSPFTERITKMGDSFNGFCKPNPDKGKSSNIKSIQRGDFTFLDGATSRSISISEVDTKKSIVIITNACRAGSASADEYGIVLTDSKTITVSRQWTTVGYSIILSWEVIEFNQVKSLQTGTLIVNTDPQSLTISSVKQDKTMIFVSFTNSNSNTSTAIFYKIRVSLTSDTSILFQGYSASASNYTVYWQVIEFY